MILVTGGAGFIGSNLVAALIERGEDVVVADDAGPEEKRRNLAKHRPHEMVRPIDCLEWIGRRAKSVAAVFHLGATTDTTARDADALKANNVDFSLALWRACARDGIPFFYASSAATYGDGSAGFADGRDPAALGRLKPLNPYGESKHRLDCAVARLAMTGEAPPRWAGLKFFNVYGPNEYHKGAMQSLVAKNYDRAARGEATALFRSTDPGTGDGEQRRDFVAVEDCVSVMLWLRDAAPAADIYNVGTGEARSFNALVGALYRAVGREPRIEYVDMPETLRTHYQSCTEADIGRLRAAGYGVPFVALEEGVARFVDRYLSRPDRYR